jgi:hypothetical protein
MKKFTFSGFLFRLVAASILVFATYNPTQYNFVAWVTSSGFSPLEALAGMALLIGWMIFARASLRSLGTIGFILIVIFFGCFIWLLIDLNLLQLDNANLLIWLTDIITSIILAIGMSWSHIRRRMSGQVDTDDINE